MKWQDLENEIKKWVKSYPNSALKGYLGQNFSEFSPEKIQKICGALAKEKMDKEKMDGVSLSFSGLKGKGLEK